MNRRYIVILLILVILTGCTKRERKEYSKESPKSTTSMINARKNEEESTTSTSISIANNKTTMTLKNTQKVVVKKTNKKKNHTTIKSSSKKTNKKKTTVTTTTKMIKDPDLRKFNVDIHNIDKVMIVAHPDDEMIWGGSHLLDDDYLVICVTCGERNDRVKEFKSVMKATNEKYIMLDYPDYPNKKKDDWKSVYKDIVADIDKILAMKDWKLIITHNKDGEYGHIHHKMTHNIVTDIYEKKYKTSNSLYFFGKYYTLEEKKKVNSKLNTISSKNFEKKREIIASLYKTQKKSCKKHEHMFVHENWEKYSN